MGGEARGVYRCYAGAMQVLCRCYAGAMKVLVYLELTTTTLQSFRDQYTKISKGPRES